jgi:hypothetical protein
MKYANIDTFRQILQIDDTLNSVYEDARNKRLQLVLEQAESTCEDYVGYSANYIPSVYQSKSFTLQFASSVNPAYPNFQLTKTGTYSVDPSLTVFNQKISFIGQTTTGTGLLTCDFVPLIAKPDKQLEVQFSTLNSNGGVVGVVYYNSANAYISDVNVPYSISPTLNSYTLALTFPANCAYFKLYINSNTTISSTTCEIINLQILNKTDPYQQYIFLNSVYRIAEFFYINKPELSSSKQGQLTESYNQFVVPPALFQPLNILSLKPARQYAGAKV